MENAKSTTTKPKTAKKSNAMKKIGKTLKDTFMEMSESLAGWIEDTGTQFSKEFGRSKARSAANRAAEQQKPPKPQLEK